MWNTLLHLQGFTQVLENLESPGYWLQVTPLQFVRFPQQFAGTHLYPWVEKGAVRVKCLAQEHNTVSPARPRIRTA